MPSADAFEKLGVFYLGTRVATDARAAGGEAADAEPVLYDARDLTTHGVCLGMTGSGKTGLCITLLEEAAIDGIPAIAIDPKGDLGNLRLTFPDLAPADFRPWIDPEEAARAGHDVDEHARAVARRWREGLARSGQDGARIARLREAVDTTIYTPGSTAGRPLTVLRSLSAPPPGLDGDALRERVQAAVSGLLSLLGLDTDPLRSREHILMARLVEDAWRDGRDLDLAGLIRGVSRPPFESVGVFDLESFFPAGERTELAMMLNNLIAAPGFAAWREGEALDVGRLLFTPDGRPRLSILSIAHLGDAERMFFVTLLLSEVVAWMRTQPGTQSLRALLYMDEVFGYLPPTAEPPSKRPLLTLLKQARAHGLGVVLATQNPVDLDYKALSNAGTWWLGRLQTERDKARVLDGLEGASGTTGAAFDRREMDRLLSGLASRTFLMHDVHEDGPVLLRTRFALSYLRGPLTREQIRRLAAEEAEGGAAAAPAAEAASAAVPAAAGAAVCAPVPADGDATVAAADASAERPVLPAGIDEAFAAVVSPRPAEGAALLYRPVLLGRAQLHYANARFDVDHWERVALTAPLAEDPEGPVWSRAVEVAAGTLGTLDLAEAPADGARFAPLAGAARRARSFPRWSKQLATHLYRHRPLRLERVRDAGLVSRPGEGPGDFAARVRQARREQRDLALEKLRRRHAPSLARLEERIRRAEAALEREREQYRGAKMQAVISLGSTVLGALLGRKLASARSVGRATTAARGAQRAADQHGDVERAGETLEALRAELAELEAAFEADLEKLRAEAEAPPGPVEPVPVRARKGDLEVERVALVWLPVWAAPDGGGVPAAAIAPPG